jgi:predicted nuclease with TOPRIM domain
MEVLETEAQMSNWNDDRLDHLECRVDEGFKRMDKEFEKVDKRFERIEERFDKLIHTLITGGVAIIVMLLASQVTMLVALFA